MTSEQLKQRIYNLKGYIIHSIKCAVNKIGTENDSGPYVCTEVDLAAAGTAVTAIHKLSKGETEVSTEVTIQIATVSGTGVTFFALEEDNGQGEVGSTFEADPMNFSVDDLLEVLQAIEVS